MEAKCILRSNLPEGGYSTEYSMRCFSLKPKAAYKQLYLVALQSLEMEQITLRALLEHDQPHISSCSLRAAGVYKECLWHK